MKLIINIDGASRGNPGPGAAAVVIKNTVGKILYREGRCLGPCTNNHAEFTALLIGLKEARELGGTDLEFRSDSQLLVNQYNGKYKIKNPSLAGLMALIKKEAAKFKRVAISHVPREQNKEADAAANEALDRAAKTPTPQAPPQKQVPAAASARPPEPAPAAQIPERKPGPAQEYAAPQPEKPEQEPKPRGKKAPAKKPEQLNLFDF